MRRLVCLLSLLLALPTLAGSRHAYHSSITELRLNPQQQQVELAIKVFADDLERAISQGRPKTVSLREPLAMPLVDAYLHQHFQLNLPASNRASRQPLTLKFLGLQPEKDAYWLYAKATLPRPTKELLVHQGMLLELFSDQMNIVNAEGNSKKISELYRNGHEESVLTF